MNHRQNNFIRLFSWEATLTDVKWQNLMLYSAQNDKNGYHGIMEISVRKQ
jgi:hypothetical protein